MKILVLHSDVPPDAPPDDLDTLEQAKAIETTLLRLYHEVSLATFFPDLAALDALIARECPDLVFNLVETVWGRGVHAPLAPAMLTQLGVPFTGGGAASLAACGDKLLAKRIMTGAELPAPAWAGTPPLGGIGGSPPVGESGTPECSPRPRDQFAPSRPAAPAAPP